MLNTLKPILTVLSVGMISAAVSAAPSNPFDRDDGYPSYTGEFKNVNGILIDRCFLDEDSGIDFCSANKAKKIKRMVDRKPTFGKTSVLMRFWDSSMNLYVYTAYNQSTKKMFFFPLGVRAINEPYKKFKLTYGKNKDRVCTSGYNVDLIGDRYTRGVSDKEPDFDFCLNYNEATGFGELRRVDAKTRKLAPDDDFEL